MYGCMFVCMFVCIKIPKKISPNSPDQDLTRSGQFGDRSFFMRKGGLVGFGKGWGGGGAHAKNFEMALSFKF